MKEKELEEYWKSEENAAQIHGWDFSHIGDRFESQEDRLPWDLKQILEQNLTPDDRLLDMDTGGGEFLLSLGHPCHRTSATEGYPPNVRLCRDVLVPLGIDFREMSDYSDMPFEDDSFDVIMNRHGAYEPEEIYRILKPGGLFITQQVGEDNDRELVELLLPGLPKSFPGMNLQTQKKKFQNAGFTVLQAQEAFRPIRFFDVGALVWFAKIIEWEFIDFSVDKCWERLLLAQQLLEKNGCVEGMTHRYLLVVEK